jgi:hypothetical protein
MKVARLTLGDRSSFKDHGSVHPQLQEEGIVLERNIRTHPEIFLKTIEKFRDNIIVAAECIFT